MNAPLKITRAQRLAGALLRDRAERAARKATRAGHVVKVERVEFDPFAIARWRVVAGGDPGYLVKTPMRRGPVGWFITCPACKREFESRGLRCCSTECARAYATPSVVGPVCLGCGKPILTARHGRRSRSDRLYHDDKCRKRHERYHPSADPPLSGISGKKAVDLQQATSAPPPIDIVGGGRRFPGAPRLDPELRRAILDAEVPLRLRRK
jgi:hypothetical protein